MEFKELHTESLNNLYVFMAMVLLFYKFKQEVE